MTEVGRFKWTEIHDWNEQNAEREVREWGWTGPPPVQDKASLVMLSIPG